MTGWIAVQRDVDIEYDLETTPLEIRSDSELGSGDLVYVYFYTSQGDSAGGVWFKLTSPPQYNIYYCTPWTNFPTDLPTARVKVWRITVIRSSGIIGLQILCNGEEVLNTVLSDSVCTSYSSSSYDHWERWNTYWNRDIAKIHFSRHEDTMSDYYRPYQPGNELIFHRLGARPTVGECYF